MTPVLKFPDYANSGTVQNVHPGTNDLLRLVVKQGFDAEKRIGLARMSRQDDNSGALCSEIQLVKSLFQFECRFKYTVTLAKHPRSDLAIKVIPNYIIRRKLSNSVFSLEPDGGFRFRVKIKFRYRDRHPCRRH